MGTLRFRRSKRCEALNQDGCVEVAYGQGRVIVRDSKDPDSPTLSMTPEVWRRMVCAIWLDAAFIKISGG